MYIEIVLHPTILSYIYVYIYIYKYIHIYICTQIADNTTISLTTRSQYIYINLRMYKDEYCQ